jgi:glutamyl-tRNA synthetase
MELLSGLDRGPVTAIEEEARAIAQDLGIKLGDVAPPLRAALTGRTVPRGVFDVLFGLGGDESLERDEESGNPVFRSSSPLNY